MDDNYSQGTPGATPPPPPPGLFPEQPAPPAAPQAPAQPSQTPSPAYTPQPGYAPPPNGPGPYPAASEPPRKKGRSCLIAAIVAAVLVCAIVSCGGIALFAASGGGDKNAAKSAEKHVGAAMSALSTATTGISGIDQGNATVIVTDANKALLTAKTELAAATTAAQEIKSTKARVDYLAALDAADQAVTGLQDLIGYAKTANDLDIQLGKAGDTATKANDALNAAIQAGNARNYTRMKSKAQTAYSEYGKAVVLFAAADRLDKSAGLVQAVAMVKKRQAQAAVVIRMAGEGSRHQTNAYNRDVDKMNALGRQAALIHEPAFLLDPNWAQKRLSVLEKKVRDAGKKADELRAQALKELGL